MPFLYKMLQFLIYVSPSENLMRCYSWPVIFSNQCKRISHLAVQHNWEILLKRSSRDSVQKSGCLCFGFCPQMKMRHLLGLRGSTFPCGGSETNAHQTQTLFLTSVACLDGKICDNGQKKVYSPVAMETSYSFFLFLFLLFSSEWIAAESSWTGARETAVLSVATAQGRPPQK